MEINIEIVKDRAVQYLSETDAEGKNRSQESLAKMAGLSSSALSQFLAGSYKGNNEAIAKKLLQVLGAEEKRQQAVLAVKEPDLVETSVMRDILYGMQYASDRNDVVVIYGPPGIGKTCTLHSYFRSNPSTIFLTVSPNICTGRDVMEELLEALGKKAEGRNRNLEKAIITSLRFSNRMIIIDEAHFLRLDGLETLRRIYDATRCPLVLVGNPKIMEMITDKNKSITGQFFSRAVRIALDNKTTLDEVTNIVNQNGLELAPNCIKELHNIASNIGALRVMVKVLLFAWTISNAQQAPVDLAAIQSAKRVIVAI